MCNKEFIPKGSMCMVYSRLYEKCNHLEFKSMRPIKKHKDGVVEVKCVEFDKNV